MWASKYLYGSSFDPKSPRMYQFKSCSFSHIWSSKDGVCLAIFLPAHLLNLIHLHVYQSSNYNYLVVWLVFVVSLSVMTCLGLFRSWLQHMKELNLALGKTFWWKLLLSPQVHVLLQDEEKVLLISDVSVLARISCQWYQACGLDLGLQRYTGAPVNCDIFCHDTDIDIWMGYRCFAKE